MIDARIEAWEFDFTRELSEIAQVAQERLAPPSFTGHVISTRGDAITLQVDAGEPSDGERSLYYLSGHGPFIVARREEWPPLPGRKAKRTLVTLLAFPQPRVAVTDPAVQ
jgi:hypothetical protein